ncbi:MULTISPECIES: class I SAM-dependent methyltransferase [unclassified Coleofasciculus]|uniref:class I SAM-dependent methyltransferase n=1 Tax=unclassified Coleofasciculus TaxID=2692782 RepID=UPI00187E3E73|nr:MULTISPECIES: class I SAM-dependent methyltransferase [unclassified Coleofasciculus]MBE9124868.1 class I SAM-dependent methyltransferase [Coleofasciculus sp. LEGE 07081]MBE9147888.1 class I SAM-dependent methyltransferase [Coleofasciculus sp. LEGE 07092]
MQNWTHGYISDVSYDYSFFPELSPTSIAFNLLDGRCFPPGLEKFTYCELGCGQGFTTNILAATNPQGEFWGMDFNPTHTAEAQRLANAAQLKNIHFSDHSFAEFIEADTPPFDFITLHGVYSWIGDENRRNIVNLLRQKLKVGGAVYISYNTLPGWSALMPLRELMLQSPSKTGDSSLQRVEAGMAFAQQLHAMKARYFLENPTVKADLDAMAGDSRNYLAHEYFNQNWRPLYHSEVVEQLADAKLTFTISGDIDDQFYNFKLTDDQLNVLADIPDITRRETIRDFLFNTRFRRDLFVKGPVKLTALEQVELLSNFRFALIIDPEEMEYEVDLVGRPIKLDEPIYQPIISALAEQPRTLRELMGHTDLKRLEFATILQALKILISTYHVTPALPAEEEDYRRETVIGLNRAILKRARFGADTQILASPVTASGIDISRPEQLFLLAYLRKADLVQFVWSILQVQGEKLIKEDQVLESPEANQAELKAQAQNFMEQRLPLFQRLGLI